VINTTMSVAESHVVGLFPSWDPGPVGGVQRSGRETWEAVVDRIGDERAHVLCYEPGSSKTKAVIRAMKTARKPGAVLVWHLDLLKLLPFIDLTGSRVLLFLHGIEAWRKQDIVTQLLLKKVSLALSNTDHTWTEFLRGNPGFGRLPHRTVHLGLDAPLVGETPRPSNVPAVLMIGRLDAQQAYKGHQQMIAAWPQVLQRVPDAQLWIVGDGDLRPALEEFAQACVTNGSVRFHGQVPDGEKDRLMAQSRCFAMPSRGDGFGLVYLEAMRMGRPCLVSTIDAGREVVNPPEAGLAVDRDDPSAVADALVRMLSCGAEWNEWSARARSRYETRFTAAHFRQGLLDALFET